MYIENGGNGKNITVQVLDAIMCHNGEFVMGEYKPCQKNKEEFLDEYFESYKNKDILLIPMTLEGCVVRISDLIGYIGRDIEDALRLGIIKIEDVPLEIRNVLGDNNKDIVNNIILDIIDNSFGKPFIKMSDKVYKAIKNLKAFNYENIYLKANSKEDIKHYEIMFNKLFDKYMDDLENGNHNSSIYVQFLDYMNDEYKKSSNARIVIDFIAGMTDDYFNREYLSISGK